MSSSLPPLKAAPRVEGKSFRIGLIQLGGTTPDKATNLARAKMMIERAASAIPKVDMIVLPEIFNSPYAAVSFPKYAEVIGFTRGEKYDMEKSASESIQMLSKAAKDAGVWLIGGSIPERSESRIYNSSPTFNRDGTLVALHRKTHLFDISVPGGVRFRESETLTGGDELTIVETEFGKISVGICYDIRFPEMTAIAARKGCIAMVYPAAFNLTTGPLHWDLLQRGRANDNQIYIVMCSPARAMGGEGYVAWGYSGVTDPSGKIVSQLEEKEDILYADIDIEAINRARAGIPVTVQRRFDVYTDVAAE